jgi:hypothetical protein
LGDKENDWTKLQNIINKIFLALRKKALSCFEWRERKKKLERSF